MTSVLCRAVAVLASGALLAACGGDDQAASSPTPSTQAAERPPSASPTPAPTAAPSPTATPTPDGPVARPDAVTATVRLETVATLDQPMATAVRPGEPDALYVAERTGRVRVLRGGTLQEAPVLDLSDQTTTDGERGLLGLTFEADGETLYVHHTNPAGDTRVAAYAMTDGTADPASRRELLAVPQPYPNHNGGELTLGPDGHLYLGLGDGGSGGDPEGNGQDPSTLLGAILRVDPDGGDPYAIPPDNPFADGEGGAPEVWAYGLRNPWRFAFDRATGDLWIGDVGQGEREEIDLVPAGEGAGWNFGWDALEGTLPYEGEAPPDAVPPVFEYDHGDGRCSVTGGRVYRGEAVPDLQGVYVFGDFCSGELRGLVLGDDGPGSDGGSGPPGLAVVDEAGLGPVVPALVAIGEDAEGELYTLSQQGDVSRIVP